MFDSKANTDDTANREFTLRIFALGEKISQGELWGKKSGKELRPHSEAQIERAFMWVCRLNVWMQNQLMNKTDKIDVRCVYTVSDQCASVASVSNRWSIIAMSDITRKEKDLFRIGDDYDCGRAKYWNISAQVSNKSFRKHCIVRNSCWIYTLVDFMAARFSR